MAEMKICRHCGNEVRSDATKCKFCKKNLIIEDTPEIFCKRCKAPVNIDDNFCQKCGAIFNIPDTEIKPPKNNENGIPYNIGILLKALAIGFAITIFATSGKDMSAGGMAVYYLAAFIIAEIFLYIYFLPTIIAIEKNKENALLLYICNLLLGVTVIGWFVTLVIALKSED